MSLLVRKVNRNNWDVNVTNVSHICADAITNCMKTKKNSMSVYEITSEADINEAFLVIASTFDHADAFDVVLMEKEEIMNLNMNLIQNPGITPIQSLENTHYDISNLSYSKLGIIADYIIGRIRDNRIIRCTKGELREIFKEAITNGRLAPDLITERFRQELNMGF